MKNDQLWHICSYFSFLALDKNGLKPILIPSAKHVYSGLLIAIKMKLKSYPDLHFLG